MWKENIWRKKDIFCGGKEEWRRKGGKYLERENVTMAGQTRKDLDFFGVKIFFGYQFFWGEISFG